MITDGPPRALKRNTPFPFIGHRTMAAAMLYCVQCGVKLTRLALAEGREKCWDCEPKEAG
jgi:hypothetical protein